MEKLELKHLAAYLPYGIEVYCPRREKVYNMAMLGNNHNRVYVEGKHFSGWIENAKPMLRPLSTIIEDDQIISLMFDLGGKMSDAIHDWIKYAKSDPANIDNAILCAPYPVVEWALENHYDIFSLIPKGLAVPLTQATELVYEQ